jgi:hypothetical protein
LSDAERAEFLTVQHQANRWTYIGSGLTHPMFLRMVERLKPELLPVFGEMAAAFA